MNQIFLAKLDHARELAETPFHINSGYRCKSHNEYVGGKPHSSHLKGVAVDIRATSSPNRYYILKALIMSGFRRIGIADSFIHVDDDYSKPQDVLWTYPG